MASASALSASAAASVAASAAAAAGGVTCIIVQPNTEPVIDDVALVEYIKRQARDKAVVRTHPMAAITKGLMGEQMAELGLLAEADAVAAEFGVEIDMKIKISGESFLTPPGPMSDLVARAVAAETGITPDLSTTGGTSDARFVKDHCPVVEFGLVGRTMHQVDERVAVDQVHQLKAIYARILRDYFA